MKKKINIAFFFLSIFAWGVINPNHALATQSHGAPEGIYAHQIAHIFFMFSMGFFIHWLRDKKTCQGNRMAVYTIRSVLFDPLEYKCIFDALFR